MTLCREFYTFLCPSSPKGYAGQASRKECGVPGETVATLKLLKTSFFNSLPSRKASVDTQFYNEIEDFGKIGGGGEYPPL